MRALVLLLLALLPACSLQATTESLASELACGWESRGLVTTPTSSPCWLPPPGMTMTPAWADSCQVADFALERAGPEEQIRLWSRLTDTADHDNVTLKACDP